MDEVYLNPRQVCELLQVTNRTLFNWDKEGKIECIRTQGGHRRYPKSKLPMPIQPKRKGKKICYCRVSSYGQKKDLETQVEFFRNRYPNHEIIKDIGSGLNFKRKGFNSILDSAIKGDIIEVVVTHKDRLCRFGFDLIERIIIEQSNGQIVVLNKEETSPEKELVDDLISIITVFSSRLYGLRSNSIKNKIKDINYKGKTIEDTKVSNISNTGRKEITAFAV